MRSVRSASGASIVELVCGMIVMVPVALFAVNIGFLSIATFLNDAACREATRVAAQQTSVDAAEAAAYAAVQSFRIAGGLAGTPQIAGGEYHSDPNPEDTVAPIEPVQMADLKLTPSPGNLALAPYASITTRLKVQTPAPMIFSVDGLQSEVELRAKYTFPVLSGIDTSADEDFSGAIDGTDGELESDTENNG